MTKSGSDSFELLLSSRARVGWGVSVATPRPSMSALYEFGGGYPDPASFPYEGMIEATADMIKAEGAAAMTYMLDGRQHVVIASGNTLVAFALPQQ